MDAVNRTSFITTIKSVFKFVNADRVAILIILIVLGYTVKLSFFPKVEKSLEIIAGLFPSDENYWEMRGRIHVGGNPVDGARVWVVLKGDGSNEDSPPAVLTNKQGEFEIDSIPRYLEKKIKSRTEAENKKVSTKTDSIQRASSDIINKVKEVKVFGSFSQKIGDDEVVILKGEKTLTVIGEASQKTISIPIYQILFLPIIFLISIIIPFLRVSPRLKYNFSIILAFLFTFAILVAISVGISFVSTSDKVDILSLGFAHIFWGTYATGVQPEWLFSLTSPSDILTSPGFGAPLWVLLLSVVGSSLYTVLIIVSEIKNRPVFNRLGKLVEDSTDNKEADRFREKLENIVRHQFYLLFSPLGAIFVYQLLVIASATGQTVTVAIAALGAGSTLNILLDKAVLASKNAFEKTKSEEKKLEEERLGKPKTDDEK